MTSPHIELLWFEDCPNHEAAERLLHERLANLGIDAPIHRIEVPDEETGVRLRFAGSPTVRIDDIDVEPGWEWSATAHLAAGYTRPRRGSAASPT